ncbi:hypothetical protein KSP39_PZI013999 [Platanthera zijinensis]|uniref:DUF4219 domain-containing protein n=1 Tax=Platanthera zijinensis TaxID=2320716 RepID=A0AAP0G3Q9_9ASPA
MASSSTSHAPLYTHSTIPIFSGELYEFWSDKMETFLRSQDLWDIVINGPVAIEKSVEGEPAKFTKEELKKDALALHLIQQGIAPAIYPRIMGSKTAVVAWGRLANEYKGSKR